MEKALLRGKAVFRIISRCSKWQARFDDLRMYSGANAEWGPVLRKISQEFADKAAELPSVREASLQDRVTTVTGLHLILKPLPDVRGKLRELATHKYENKFLTCFQEYWANLDRRTSAEIVLLHRLHECLELLCPKLEKALNLKQNMHEQLIIWQQQDRLGTLRVAATGSLDTETDVQNYLARLKEAKAMEIPEDVSQLVQKSGVTVFRRLESVATALRFNSALSSSELNHLVDTLELIAGHFPEGDARDLKSIEVAYIKVAVPEICDWFTIIGTLVEAQAQAAPGAAPAAVAMQDLQDAVKLHESLLDLLCDSNTSSQNYSNEAKSSLARIFQHLDGNTELARSTLISFISPSLVQQAIAISRAAAELRPKAGGASSGTSWYSNFTEGSNVLEYFETTLDKVKTSDIDSKMTKLESATWELNERSAGGMLSTMAHDGGCTGDCDGDMEATTNMRG